MFGLVFVVCGIAFKLGVVPFHMWIPDVYHGAPTAVTLVIGTAPKLAAFAMAMRLLVNGLLDLAHDWQQMLAILAVLSMALGNIAAIAQTNLKRMLAYSTIAHMGFMLLGLLSGVVGGNWLNAADAYAASMFYTLVYVLMSAGSFGMLLFLSRKGFECENLDDLKGLNRRNPWYAFIMLLLMFSLAGVPPTAGFYAKLAVLSAAVNAGQIWLAVFAVAASRSSAPTTTCASSSSCTSTSRRTPPRRAGVHRADPGHARAALGQRPRAARARPAAAAADVALLPRHQEPVTG